MTTAHRPTWHQALGGSGQGGNKLVSTSKTSSRDLPGHKTLKTRTDINTSSSLSSYSSSDKDNGDIREGHKRALEEREKSHRAKQIKNASVTTFAKNLGLDSSSDKSNKTREIEEYNPFPEDADDEGTGKCGYSSSDEDDDENDDEAELLRELEQIKQEREEEQRKKRAELQRIEDEKNKEKALYGNPLLMGDRSGGPRGGGIEDNDESTVPLTRRWDDDVVFKYQSRGKQAPNPNTFINDTVRSPFHRKFLNKYIQ